MVFYVLVYIPMTYLWKMSSMTILCNEYCVYIFLCISLLTQFSIFSVHLKMTLDLNFQSKQSEVQINSDKNKMELSPTSFKEMKMLS